MTRWLLTGSPLPLRLPPAVLLPAVLAPAVLAPAVLKTVLVTTALLVAVSPITASPITTATVTASVDESIENPGPDALKEALCPVCRVHDGETELEEVLATSQFEGQTYGFCSEGCRDTFEELPQAYLPPVFPRPAPAFSARSLEGEIVSTEELRGKLTLVDFWATWCLPCVEDLPRLSSLDARYRQDGFQVLGISIDEGDQAAKKVRKMIRKTKAGHSIYLDSEENSAWAAFQVRVVPSQFLVDEKGHIVDQWTGAIDLDAVETAIVEHLALREPAVREPALRESAATDLGFPGAGEDTSPKKLSQAQASRGNRSF